VLSAALRANPQDASAHYLLGTLYFSKGLADEAFTEWQRARKLNPGIPVLHASLGRALLELKDNPQQAFTVFQEGLSRDPRNEELYTGMDQALSIMQHSPLERVAALEHYPDSTNIPIALIYELILNLAESGDFDKAVGLFHNRFFPREEGGTNVRQVWLEVQVLRAISLAKQGQCPEAVNIANHLSDPVPDLIFTHDGLEPFLRSARFNYLLGTVYKRCDLPDRARTSFAEGAELSSLPDAVWSFKAAQELPESDQGVARQKLETSLERLKNSGESSAPTGWWLYNAAMLDEALGNTQRAASEFHETLLRPDQLLSYHLTRLALSGSHP
jgi:tetratricopeptide (TPR) repeat protein